MNSQNEKVKQLLNSLLTKVKPLYSHLNKHKISYGLGLTLITYIILSFYLASYLPDTFKDYSIYTNLTLTIIGIFIYGKFLHSLYKGTSQPGYRPDLRFIGYMFVIPFIAILVLILFTTSTVASTTITYIMNAIVLVGILLIIYTAIQKIPLFRTIKDFLNEFSIFKIIYHIIFYLPCLIEDVIEQIKSSSTLASTPTYIYYILGIEIGIIAMYFLIPKLIKYIQGGSEKVVLDNPIKLDKMKTHATYEELNGKTVISNDVVKPNYNYNYGLSFWVFLNEQAPNQNENSDDYVSILNYGGKPNIQYNNELRKLRVTVKSSKLNDKNDYIIDEQIIYESEPDKFKLQKWNNIVVNYLSGKLDVFINKELVATSIYDKGQNLAYLELDSLTSGYNRGLSGGIANIQYSKEPISKRNIDWKYNSYKGF